jgi:hypothetical protein
MKPYHEGRQAFRKGRIGNPYKENTKDYRDWEFGWNKGYYQNLERVRKIERARNKEMRSVSSVQEPKRV